jgi:N-acetylglucosamine-6-phosphate deacetylase
MIPVDFPKPPEVAAPEAARDVSLETLMDWDLAPENPARLAAAGVNFSFTSTGLEKVGDLLDRVRTAVKRGLAKETALEALTINPARFLNLADQLGSIANGKLANFVVTDGDLFEAKSEIVETWVAGRRFEADPKPLRDLAGTWELNAKDKGLKGLRLSVKSRKGKLSAEFVTDKKPAAKADADKTPTDDSKQEDSKNKQDEAVKLDDVSLDGTRLVGTFKSEKFGHPGVSQLSIVVATDGTGDGQVVLPDGNSISVTIRKLAEEKPVDEEKDEDEDKDKEGDKDRARNDRQPEKASYAVNHPLGAFGRETAPEQPASVLIKNVTVWTCGPQGKLVNGAVLFGKGRIQGVYSSEAKLPTADIVIDGTGKHLSPGIIDCHSHSATDSGVNESGQAVTAEVRIGDFIDADSINIYRQLAGGVTTINILHGSANPIGGQNQVVKLRWGALGEDMKFAEAPPGIKFALGENVKRSNSPQRPGDDARYPLTRMGVVEIIENSFRAAEEYRQRQTDWQANREGLPLRKDLELEALAEVVEGKRWIHCHSYRQDEILALIRTLDKHGITIGTFQHILEGYKVADEMAKHGAMASAFADWWAYKYEVKDAIPYAGALMYRAGVKVSYNSDDAELARHLNHEAAKAVRYGGVPEEDALKFVTLNPAMQLRIDQYVGSIEPGKHADLVLWSGSPLSTLSRCEQTWVDGRKYFDLQEDATERQKNKDMRTALIQKVLASGEEMETRDSSKTDPARLWPRYDENCGMLGHHYDDRQFNGLHQGHTHQNQ